MTNPIILRRRKLGRTSVREIAKFMETPCTPVRNWVPADLAKALEHGPIDLVFRWGCTDVAPHGAKVINKADAISFVTDKGAFRSKAGEHCVPTFYSPRDYFVVYENHPAVVRTGYHAQARGFWYAVGHEQVREYFQRAQSVNKGGTPYISPFIDKIEEYRVFVCEHRAVWVAKKTPADPKAHAWNVAKGGRFDNVRWGDWPLKAVRVAIETSYHIPLDFCGIDVMVAPNDNIGNRDTFVLEANSAPSQTSPYRQQCVAKVFDSIVKNGGVSEYLLVEEKGDWKKFIHPALSDRALVDDDVEDGDEED